MELISARVGGLCRRKHTRCTAFAQWLGPKNLVFSRMPLSGGFLHLSNRSGHAPDSDPGGPWTEANLPVCTCHSSCRILSRSDSTSTPFPPGLLSSPCRIVRPKTQSSGVCLVSVWGGKVGVTICWLVKDGSGLGPELSGGVGRMTRGCEARGRTGAAYEHVLLPVCTHVAQGEPRSQRTLRLRHCSHERAGRRRFLGVCEGGVGWVPRPVVGRPLIGSCYLFGPVILKEGGRGIGFGETEGCSGDVGGRGSGVGGRTDE